MAKDRKLSEVIKLLRETIDNKKALKVTYQQKLLQSPNAFDKFTYEFWVDALRINIDELEKIAHDLEENVGSLD